MDLDCFNVPEACLWICSSLLFVSCFYGWLSPISMSYVVSLISPDTSICSVLTLIAVGDVAGWWKSIRISGRPLRRSYSLLALSCRPLVKKYTRVAHSLNSPRTDGSLSWLSSLVTLIVVNLAAPLIYAIVFSTSLLFYYFLLCRSYFGDTVIGVLFRTDEDLSWPPYSSYSCKRGLVLPRLRRVVGFPLL